MTKIQTIISDLSNANQRLAEALNAEASDLNQDASIQRFEFTFELSWKLMQEILTSNLRKTRGVKDVIRQAVDFSLIDNFQIWFDFLENRNLTVHTYKLETARSIYTHIKNFPTEVDKLLKNSQDLINS